MKVTRNVIMDLLPIYIAEEASDDTKRLVSDYLERDPELARMAKDVAETDLPDDAPVPLKWEDKMKAYREAKKLMLIRTIALAAIISISFLALLGLIGTLAMFLLR
jgi:hypothetical protein